jgi:hypothetical protein
MTPLLAAAYKGHLQVVKLLLAAKADTANKDNVRERRGCLTNVSVFLGVASRLLSVSVLSRALEKPLYPTAGAHPMDQPGSCAQDS